MSIQDTRAWLRDVETVGQLLSALAANRQTVPSAMLEVVAVYLRDVTEAAGACLDALEAAIASLEEALEGRGDPPQ